LPSHIGIELIGKADAAAKREIQLNVPEDKHDQIFNKLHSVKPVLREWLTGNLKRED